jgi:3-methylcrotonyl-CoA carboxylase alpha subunit
VIAAGEDRFEAVQALLESLDAQALAGLITNQGFVYRCLSHPEFQAGAVHTGFIPAHLPTLLDRGGARAAAVARLAALPVDGGADPWALADGWRSNLPAQRVARFEVEGELAEVALAPPPGGGWDWDWEDGASLQHGDVRLQLAQGEVFACLPPGASADLEDAAAGDEIKAPLPGKIVALAVEPGRRVEKGELLATLEAMKMEHALKAPRAGVVAAVGAELGQQVSQGAVLVALEPEG